jgi:hypothetical protein
MTTISGQMTQHALIYYISPFASLFNKLERTTARGYLLKDTRPRNRVYEKARTTTQLLLFVCLNYLRMLGPLLFFFLWEKNELVQFVKDILESRFGPGVVSSAHQAREYLFL